MNGAPRIGIDFGTSKSVVTWLRDGATEPQIVRNEEGDESTPSVAYLGHSEKLFGNSAVNMTEDEDEAPYVVASCKRDLRLGLTYALPGDPGPVEVAAEILRYLLGMVHKDAEVKQFLNGPVETATITCPATFSPLERDRLIEAGKLAGLKHVALLDEPTAAAMACAKALPKAVGKTLLVYDLGAGTFDLAVLTKDGRGEWRPAIEPLGARLGGDDFDSTLFGHFDGKAKEAHGEGLGGMNALLKVKCRRAKESAVTHGRTNFSHVMPNGKVFKCVVTRDEFHALISAHVDLTITHVERALDLAKKNDAPVDSCVLIGGSSRIPLIKDRLTALLGIPTLEWGQRDFAVAVGALCGRPEPMHNGEAAPTAIDKPPTPEPVCRVNGATSKSGQDGSAASKTTETSEPKTLKDRLEAVYGPLAAFTQVGETRSRHRANGLFDVKSAFAISAVEFAGLTTAFGDRAGNLWMWDVVTGSEELSMTLPSGVTALSTRTFGNVLLAGCNDGSIHLIRRSKPQDVIHDLTGHGHTVAAVGFGTEGYSLYSIDEAGFHRRWSNAESESTFFSDSVLNSVSSWVHGVFGGPVSAKTSKYTTNWIKTMQSSPEETSFLSEVAPGTVIASANGRAVAASGLSGNLLFCDSKTSARRTLVGFTGEPPLALSRDGRLVAITLDGSLFVWRPLSDKSAEPTKIHNRLPCVSGADSWFRQITLSRFPRARAAVCFSGKYVISSDSGGDILVSSVETGNTVGCCHGHSGAVTQLAVSPDGEFLISAGADNTIRLWKLP